MAGLTEIRFYGTSHVYHAACQLVRSRTPAREKPILSHEAAIWRRGITGWIWYLVFMGKLVFPPQGITLSLGVRWYPISSDTSSGVSWYLVPK